MAHIGSKGIQVENMFKPSPGLGLWSFFNTHITMRQGRRHPAWGLGFTFEDLPKTFQNPEQCCVKTKYSPPETNSAPPFLCTVNRRASGRV